MDRDRVKSNNTDSTVDSVRTEVTAAVLNVTQQFQHFQGDKKILVSTKKYI